ncbi:MAG: hypothetical protein DYH18_01915 [Xanthomonadales bacterium PRO7]|nr:hypothetical protein [Xanthomonadales bacterium PRO7]
MMLLPVLALVGVQPAVWGRVSASRTTSAPAMALLPLGVLGLLSMSIGTNHCSSVPFWADAGSRHRVIVEGSPASCNVTAN